MSIIKIINSLCLSDDGVYTKTKNGKLQKVHLQQGDLDGACAVYSSLMILILIGAIRRKDLEIEYDKRFGIEKLKKELLDTKGMHRNGNHFYHESEDNLKNMLKRSFSRQISVEHVDKDVINSIKYNIENDLPALISISYTNGAHAVVAIGIESNCKSEITKILCLDPAYPSPKFTYWNSVIDLQKYTGKKYCFRNFTESGTKQQIKLDDILIIKRK